MCLAAMNLDKTRPQDSDSPTNGNPADRESRNDACLRRKLSPTFRSPIAISLARTVSTANRERSLRDWHERHYTVVLSANLVCRQPASEDRNRINASDWFRPNALSSDRLYGWRDATYRTDRPNRGNFLFATCSPERIFSSLSTPRICICSSATSYRYP